MYFPEKPISSRDTDFVRSYESYLSVSVVGNYGIQGRRSLVADTKRINSDLFLDPDTGLWWAPSGRHPKHQVKIDELVNIVTSIERKDKLTLVFDQSKDHTSKSPDFLKQAKMKLACLRRNGVHAVAYTAHEGSGVRFILVSASCKAISLATRSMQSASGFPCWRFLDDGCGHVLGQKKKICRDAHTTPTNYMIYPHGVCSPSVHVRSRPPPCAKGAVPPAVVNLGRWAPSPPLAKHPLCH